MKERIIIVVVAVVAGLAITGIGFVIYQSTKKVESQSSQKPTDITIPPKDESKIFVNVTEPSDESLVTKRTLTIKGTTNPDNIIVVSTNLEDVQAKPTGDGNFTVTVDIDAGANLIRTKAIATNGDSSEDLRTVTYSTEEF